MDYLLQVATKADRLMNDMWKAASSFNLWCIWYSQCLCPVCLYRKKDQWKYYIYGTKMQMWTFCSNQYNFFINNNPRDNKYYLVSHVAPLGHAHYKLNYLKTMQRWVCIILTKESYKTNDIPSWFAACTDTIRTSGRSSISLSSNLMNGKMTYATTKTGLNGVLLINLYTSK